MARCSRGVGPSDAGVETKVYAKSRWVCAATTGMADEAEGTGHETNEFGKQTARFKNSTAGVPPRGLTARPQTKQLVARF